MFFQADVDLETPDEPFSRMEFSDIKMELSDLKLHVEALWKKSNLQLSSPVKRKGNDDLKGKQSSFLKNIRINLICNLYIHSIINELLK